MNTRIVGGLALAITLAATGCGPGATEKTTGNPAPGSPSVAYASVTVTPGPECANGGVRVDAGIDDDRNGRLDPAEVDGWQYVCNGAPGATSLVRVDEEPPGLVCRAGGVRVQSGIDSDGDGALGDPEVSHTAYACAATSEAPAGAPDTAITAGPARTTTSREATFWFAGAAASSFRCSLDGAAAEPCAAPVSYAALADGPHAFETTALDAGGQADASPARYAWTVDATPPDVTISSAPPAYTADPLATIAFAVSEPGARATCALDHVAAPCTSPWSAGALADGAHEVAISAVDAAGNADLSPVRVAFTVDTRRPATIVDLAPATPALPSVALAFHADEPATFRCAVDGAAPVACTSPYSLAGLSDGAHEVVVAAVDLAGNADAAPPAVAFSVDGRAPDTAVVSGPPDLAATRAATFSLASTVEGSTFRCALDGGAPSPCAALLSLTGLADGAHALAAVAVSPAGLADPTPAVRAWTVDATPPETAFTATPPDVTPSDAAVFRFASPDAGATFVCALDVAAPGACTSPLSLAGLSRGMHQLRVAAIDAAGNEDPTPAAFFCSVQGETPPPAGAVDTFIAGGPADPTREMSVAIFFGGTGAAGFECALDGGAPAPCASPFRASGLAEGRHAFAVAALDAAGVADPTPATLAWRIDTTPPEVRYVGGPADFSRATASTATFAFASNEPSTTFLCSIDEGAAFPCGATYTTPALADGIHYFGIGGVDEAGNTTIGLSTLIWWIDTVPPAATIAEARSDGAAGTATVRVQLSEAAEVAWTLDGVEGSPLCAAAADPGFPPHDAWMEPDPVPGGYAITCSGLPDGSHALAIAAADRAGNVAPPVAFDFAIDRPPEVTFTERPEAVTSASDATFAFTSTKPATFTCALDGAPAAPCASPAAFTALADGSHLLDVTATSETGAVGRATYAWRIDSTPPQTYISGVPTGVTNARTAYLALSASESPVTYRCTLDGATYDCTITALTIVDLAEGEHTFTAAAVDAAGNVDPTPATRTWTVDLTPPASPVTFTVEPGIDHLVVRWTAEPGVVGVQVFVTESATAPLPQYPWWTTSSPASVTMTADGAVIEPCRDYWVRLVAIDVAENWSAPTPAQGVSNAPPVPDLEVVGRDGVVNVVRTAGPTTSSDLYVVEYGAAPGVYDGTEAAEGASPVAIPWSSLGLHGFPADAIRWFRTSIHYGATCSSPAIEQLAAPYPWRPVSASPAYGSYAAVACPGGGPACVAVGANGLAVRTTDGASWTRANGGNGNGFGSGMNFADVAMPTASTGYAVADGGWILRTTDGGATWLGRGFVRGAGGQTAAGVGRIAFAGVDVGWAASPNGLYVTRDGGATWTLSLAGSWTAVHAFADGLGAIAVGPLGALRTTSDGGTTWVARATATPSNLVAVTCPTETRCYVGGQSGTFLVSDDGGVTWVARANLSFTVNRFAFSDAGHGWVLDDAGVVARTEDGGTTWSSWAAPDLAYDLPKAIAATGSSGVWVVGLQGMIARRETGGTWAVARRAQRVGAGATVHALGPGSVLAVGVTGALRSVDGGDTWAPSTYPGGASVFPQRIAFANDRVGLVPATSPAGFLKTLDGGATWTAVAGASPFTPSDVQDLTCLRDEAAPARCFAATALGVYRSDDGGDTWTSVATPLGTTVDHVRFLDASRGFVAEASTQALYQTIDGGASWSAVPGTGFGALEVVPPSTVISGAAVSFDAGTTWEPASGTGRTWVGSGLSLRAASAGTFRVTPLAPGLPGARTRFLPAGVAASGFAIAGAETWFLVDGDGVVWKTTTAGR